MAPIQALGTLGRPCVPARVYWDLHAMQQWKANSNRFEEEEKGSGFLPSFCAVVDHVFLARTGLVFSTQGGFAHVPADLALGIWLPAGALRSVCNRLGLATQVISLSGAAETTSLCPVS